MNKCQPKTTIQVRNRYLDYLINTGFKGVNRLFALSFKNNTSRANKKRYYHSKGKIKDYNAIIDGRNPFDQLITKNFTIYDNIYN